MGNSHENDRTGIFNALLFERLHSRYPSFCPHIRQGNQWACHSRYRFESLYRGMELLLQPRIRQSIWGKSRATHFKTRILHTFGFEGGLIFISIPTIMFGFLQIGWFGSMGLEAVFWSFFFFYSTLFHWCYDKYQPYKTWFTMQATKVK